MKVGGACGCAGEQREPGGLASGFGRVLGGLFGVYRRLVSPVLMSSGLGRCRYLPSCSEYAEVALLRHGMVRGTWLAAGRLLRCHPWAAGGLDPVPPRKRE